ncbi:histone H1 [Pedobacter sp. AW31-3R]|uniref:histone H1 n=1 Tax=Pedobacter sp. AW31-3R TaxID=3445781 RepID=UPI003FA07783
MKQLVFSAEKDAQKFYLKGNRSAGVRLRAALQKSKVLAQEVRQSVLAKKNKK